MVTARVAWRFQFTDNSMIPKIFANTFIRNDIAQFWERGPFASEGRTGGGSQTPEDAGPAEMQFETRDKLFRGVLAW